MKFKYFQPHIDINKLMKEYMEVEENKERVDKYISKMEDVVLRKNIFMLLASIVGGWYVYTDVAGGDTGYTFGEVLLVWFFAGFLVFASAGIMTNYVFKRTALYLEYYRKITPILIEEGLIKRNMEFDDTVIDNIIDKESDSMSLTIFTGIIVFLIITEAGMGDNVLMTILTLVIVSYFIDALSFNDRIKENTNKYFESASVYSDNTNTNKSGIRWLSYRDIERKVHDFLHQFDDDRIPPNNP